MAINERHFILHQNRDDIRQNCIEAIEALPRNGKWEVTIEEYSPDRSITANAGYWGYVLTPAAEQLGYESVKELHRQICSELYGVRRVAFAGKVYEEPIRTTTHPTTMSRKEFADHTERAAALLIGQGVILPARETWFT
jgi:hypothetical protein